MRRLGITLSILLAVTLLAGCSSESIYGSWQHDASNVQYTFNEDMSFVITVVGGKTYNGTFELDEENSSFLAHAEGYTQSGEYKIEDKQLIITSPDSGSVITMTRIKKDDGE